MGANSHFDTVGTIKDKQNSNKQKIMIRIKSVTLVRVLIMQNALEIIFPEEINIFYIVIEITLNSQIFYMK